jgi:host factor-I protein
MITKSEASKLHEKGVDELYLFLNELEKKYKSEQPKSHAPAIAAIGIKELNVTTPSVRKLHNLIKERALVSIKLRTGESVQGGICWIDTECLCLEGEEQVIIWFKAIAFVQPL